MKTDKAENTDAVQEETVEDPKTVAQNLVDKLKAQQRVLIKSQKLAAKRFQITKVKDDEETELLNDEQIRIEVELDEAQEVILAINKAEKEAIAAKVREEIRIESGSTNIDVSWIGEDQDLIVRTLSGFCGAMQFMDVNGESYFEYLQMKTYSRDDGTAFATNPELQQQHEARFDRLRDQRHQVKVLRAALHDKFDEELMKLDTSNMTSPPIELYRTDQQVRMQAQVRQEKKSASIRAENDVLRKQAREAYALQEGTVLPA